VIADELSFDYDYYYSSLPISYSKCCLPILSIILSILCIGFCLTALIGISFLVQEIKVQFYCTIWCIKQSLLSNPSYGELGIVYYDIVPVFLLLVLTMTAEVRDMASYICSNWTKVILICRYGNRASSQHYHSVQKWVKLLLRCRCQLMRDWDEEMGQCSVLMQPSKMSPLVLVRRLLHLPDHKRKAKVPAAVKVCIINALSNSFVGGLSQGVASLHRNQVGESFLWACNGKGTSDTILVWHIATCILEMKHPYRSYEEQGSRTIPSSDHKIAATHLSRYCAYLVTWCPELLPDNAAWSKGLYEAVKKDAGRALNGYPAKRLSTPEVQYQQLVEVLTEKSKHETTRTGDGKTPFIPAASYYLGEAARSGVLQEGLQKSAARCFLQIWSDRGPPPGDGPTTRPPPTHHPTTSRASSCCAESRCPALSVLLRPTVEREGEGIRLMTTEGGRCRIWRRPPAPSSTRPPWRRGFACRP
jgi:hypothetical protein